MTEGKRHLGASIGSEGLKAEYVNEKVKTWCDEIQRLGEFAKIQPHCCILSIYTCRAASIHLLYANNRRHGELSQTT